MLINRGLILINLVLNLALLRSRWSLNSFIRRLKLTTLIVVNLASGVFSGDVMQCHSLLVGLWMLLDWHYVSHGSWIVLHLHEFVVCYGIILYVRKLFWEFFQLPTLINRIILVGVFLWLRVELIIRVSFLNYHFIISNVWC